MGIIDAFDTTETYCAPLFRESGLHGRATGICLKYNTAAWLKESAPGVFKMETIAIRTDRMLVNTALASYLTRISSFRV
jgi:hypothetical protein